MPPKLKKHNCNICRRMFATASSLKQHRVDAHNNVSVRRSAPSAARPRSRPNSVKNSVVRLTNRFSSATSLNTFSLEEPLIFSENLSTYTFLPGVSGLPRLDQMGRLYEQFKLIRLSYHFKPSVGAMNDGFYAAGIDTDAKDLPTTLHSVLVLQPKVYSPVWKETTLTVNPSMVMKGLWHFTAHHPSRDSPSYTHAIAVYCEKFRPMCLVNYTVQFQGPTSGQKDQIYTYTDSKWYDSNGKVITQIDNTPHSSVPYTYQGPKSYWDSFVKLLENVSVNSESLVGKLFRITGTFIAHTPSIVMPAGATDSTLLSLRGVLPQA